MRYLVPTLTILAATLGCGPTEPALAPASDGQVFVAADPPPLPPTATLDIVDVAGNPVGEVTVTVRAGDTVIATAPADDSRYVVEWPPATLQLQVELTAPAYLPATLDLDATRAGEVIVVTMEPAGNPE